MRSAVFYKVKRGDVVELDYDGVELGYDGMCYRIDKVITMSIFSDSPDSQYVTVKNGKHQICDTFGSRFIKNIL